MSKNAANMTISLEQLNDDDSIFITQTPRSEVLITENINDQVIDDFDVDALIIDSEYVLRHQLVQMKVRLNSVVMHVRLKFRINHHRTDHLQKT